MIDYAQRANRLHWPPWLYLTTLLAAWVAGRLVPIAPGFAPPWLRVAGWLLFACGVAIGLAGIGRFRSGRTPVDPTACAQALVTDGIYRFTRNPMYAGAVVAYAGLGLAWPSVWLLLLTPAMAVGLQRLAIEREERHLEVRFGQAFLDYKACVRRWL